MAKHPKQDHSQQNTVQKLQNDYVRSSDSKAQRRKKQKVLFRRRMLVFSIFAAIVLFFLIHTIVKQNERLAEKEAEKEDVMVQLDAVKEKQEMLNLQIKKLEDDEYLAKLARKEYFLSDEGEIIFTIPEEDGKKEDKKDEESKDGNKK